jgi:type I restriction-modification system DNA methylase subunit
MAYMDSTIPASFEEFQKDLHSLVESFRKRRPFLKDEGYDEMQLRTDFLNSFWKALGWDVENRQRLAQSLREVEVETRVHIAGTKKRVDYAFRIGGLPKFVCEAKKATDDLTKKHAYQAQRYAFNMKLFVCVLTNFECLKMFVVGGRPDEQAPFPVFKQWDFLNYEDSARELWDLFSKEGVKAHSLEDLVSSLKKRPIPGRGRQDWRFVPERVRTVDEEFLEYIEQQREELARLLVAENPKNKWTDSMLNECIQRIIDRILFVRICEDRDIDTGRSLVAILDEWEQITVNRSALYPRIIGHFNLLDTRFNGTLFHKGHESESLKIPDEFLVDMIRELSSEDSPYLFSTLPVEILGSVYEQFIGKVVRLTRSGTVKVELKPEVRHAGGVYYTPRYVVDYIVEQTVGTLVTTKSPPEIAALRFLDPACGSGSFLLRVFERVCEEHITWLEAHPGQQKEQNCYRDATGTLQLTTHFKRQLMLNNVYGVDIDFRAVEVTMLSLYLKILEGETRTTLGQNRSLFPAETFLPDLTNNIKCGNSLIGQDFYAGEQLEMIGAPVVVERVNAFDWEAEFKSILADGGFHAVLGNPPYVLLQDDLRDDTQLDYFRSKYRVASYKIDLYHLFVERGIRLTRTGGRCAMITPANFLTNKYLVHLRRLLLDETNIGHILVIDGGVFKNVSVDNAIFVVVVGEKTSSSWPLVHAIPDDDQFRKVSEISVRVAAHDKESLFTGSGKSSKLWEKILKRSLRLGQLADVNFGKQLRDRREFHRDVIDVATRKIPKTHMRCYTGKDVGRYRLTWGALACLDDTIAQRGGCWDDGRQNAKNKIVTRQIGAFPIFALDSRGYQCLNTMFMINVHPPYDRYFILGTLNSHLIKAFWLDKFFDQRRTFPKIKGGFLEQLPIYEQPEPDKATERKVKQTSQLAKALVKMYGQIGTKKSERHHKLLQRQINAAEQTINRMLYELYELDPGEVAKIEALAMRPGSNVETCDDGLIDVTLHKAAKTIPETKKIIKRKRVRSVVKEQSGLLFQ